MAFPTTGIIDNFDRSNATSLGANWTDDFFGGVGSGWRIVANRASMDLTNFFESAYYSAATYGPDCEVYCTVQYTMDSTTRLEIWARITDPGSGAHDGYLLRCGSSSDPTAFGFEKDVNGVNSAVGSDMTHASLVADDRVGMEIVGTSLQAYTDTGSGWAALGTARSDSSLTGAGYLGMRARDAGLIDDFGGGTIVTGPSYPNTPIDLTLFPKHKLAGRSIV